MKFPANGTVPFVTVGGLTPNVAYAFAVAAYDEDGELLGGGAGAPTRAVVAAPSIPTTMLWSNLAVAASRLGCVHVARRAAGTVCRRFVETKRADTPWAAHPTSTRKLRVAVVDAAVSPISRAACRAMFVAAEVALATRKKFGGRNDPVTAHSLAHSERAFDETFRLDVGKRLVLAAELACRADDATLAQEAALRFANCVAPVLASATRPRAMVAAIAQCLETLAESGKARTTTIARCAASLAFELASRAASTGEWKTLADVAALRVDALDPPLGAPNPTRADLEQYLLSIPGWRGFESEALASRADAAGATEAEDPLALVASKIAEDGVDAGFEALTALGKRRTRGTTTSARFSSPSTPRSPPVTRRRWRNARRRRYARTSDATRVPPPAFPDPPASEAPAELEPEEETRVAELENAAAEVASVVEPEPLAETHTEEERAAWEEAREAWERARPIKEAAEGAREDATARAEIREKAARALTRKLPPLFARRNAALAARPIVAANAPWHAAVRTALGRAAHEAVVAKWTPPENSDAEKETDASNANRDDPDANASPPPPPPPPPALDAVVELTRGVEIAARCGDVGRLTDAVRALYDAIADPRVGVDAENGRLAKHGGARYLHVAGARVVEHLQRLRDGAVDAGVLVDVGGGESPSPVVAAVAADDAAATERRAYMRDPDEDARRTPEPWHAAHGDADVAFLTRFVVTAADACAAAGYHHRASSLYLDAVDAAETDAFAIEILPRAAKSARAAEYTEAPAEGDAAEARLRRALAARPPHVVALADARRLATTHETFAEAREAFAEAIALAKSAGDRDAAAQAQLELGDARAAVGDLTGAMMEWSACLDQIVGVYDAAYTRGSSALPPDASSIFETYGFWKSLRGAAAAARMATHGGAAPERGSFGLGRRIEAARVASNFYAVVFLSTVARGRRPVEWLAGGDFLSRAPARSPRIRATEPWISSTDGTTIAFASSRRRVSRSRAAAFSANQDARWMRFPRFVSRNRSRRGTSATSRSSPRRASNSPTSRRISDNSPSRPTPSRRSCTGRGSRPSRARSWAEVFASTTARSRRDRNRFRRGWGSRSTPSSDIPRTAPRERASRPRRRVTR